MSVFFNDVAWYLEDQGIGTMGTDIFAGELPAEPDNCIAILGLVSGPANVDIRAFSFPRFQIVVRNTSFDDGAEKMQALRSVLHVAIGVLMRESFVLRCHADQEGGPIGRDSEGRYEFAINFEAEIRDAASGDSL